MNNIRTILIDDEMGALNALREQIKMYCPEVVILGAFDDPRKGLDAIRNRHPDVVFLDIQMPGMTGLELAGLIKSSEINIIFVTAFDHYAIHAIKLSALDYLMKPVDPDELRLAIGKVKLQAAQKNGEDANRMPVLGKLLQDSQMQSYSQDTIIGLPDEQGVSYVKIKDVIRLEANRNYCNFYLMDGTMMLVSKNIGFFIESVQKYNLVQVHRAHVVNRSHVKRYVRLNGPYLKMCDGSEVPVSKLFKDNF